MGYVTPAQQYDVISVGDVATDLFIRLSDGQVERRADERGTWLVFPLGSEGALRTSHDRRGWGERRQRRRRDVAPRAPGRCWPVSSPTTSSGAISSGRCTRSGSTRVSFASTPRHTRTATSCLSFHGERTILVWHEEFDYHWPHLRPSEVPSWLHLTSLGAACARLPGPDRRLARREPVGPDGLPAGHVPDRGGGRPPGAPVQKGGGPRVRPCPGGRDGRRLPRRPSRIAGTPAEARPAAGRCSRRGRWCRRERREHAVLGAAVPRHLRAPRPDRRGGRLRGDVRRGPRPGRGLRRGAALVATELHERLCTSSVRRRACCTTRSCSTSSRRAATASRCASSDVRIPRRDRHVGSCAAEARGLANHGARLGRQAGRVV